MILFSYVNSKKSAYIMKISNITQYYNPCTKTKKDKHLIERRAWISRGKLSTLDDIQDYTYTVFHFFLVYQTEG